MCVQYIGGCSVHSGGIMSTSGDIFSTLEDVWFIREILHIMHMGVYNEYVRGGSVHQRASKIYVGEHHK